MENKTVVSTAPPPPSEVKIRTMRSDLASMRASGGGAPKFQNVAIPGLTLDKEYRAGNVQPTPSGRPVPSAPAIYDAPRIPVTHEVDADADEKRHIIQVIVVVAIGIVALFAVGIVAYTVFSK